MIQQIKNDKKITITDPKMTRFSITMKEALDFILHASTIGQGSEIFIPKLNAYSIEGLSKMLQELFGKVEEQIIGIRPGEKLHETLINREEIRYSKEIENMYMITNPLYPLFHDDEIKTTYPGIKNIENMSEYSSNNVDLIPKETLQESIKTLELKLK